MLRHRKFDFVLKNGYGVVNGLEFAYRNDKQDNFV